LAYTVKTDFVPDGWFMLMTEYVAYTSTKRYTANVDNLSLVGHKENHTTGIRMATGWLLAP